MLTFKKVNTLTIIMLIGILTYGFLLQHTIYPLVILLFLLWVILTTIGSFNILWNYFLTAKNSNKNSKENIVSLTFDDGVNPEITPKVLDLLKKYNTKATFFCIGKNIEKYPKLAQRIVAEGHSIGNHTYNHSNKWGFLSTEKVLEEIKKNNEIIEQITGKQTKLFRPPFGVTNPHIAKATKQLNCEVIGWNVRSLDTVIKNEEKILNRITKKVKKGDVILLHDNSEKTVVVLEQLLYFLEKKKLKSVTIEALFNI